MVNYICVCNAKKSFHTGTCILANMKIQRDQYEQDCKNLNLEVQKYDVWFEHVFNGLETNETFDEEFTESETETAPPSQEERAQFDYPDEQDPVVIDLIEKEKQEYHDFIKKNSKPVLKRSNAVVIEKNKK